jgi:hypothetical protein
MTEKETRYILEIITYVTKKGESDLIEVSRTQYETNGQNLFKPVPQFCFRDDVEISYEMSVVEEKVYEDKGRGYLELVTKQQ